MSWKRILAIAPHSDDIELGCGGTIAKFLEKKKEIFCTVFSFAEKSVPEGLPKNVLKREFFQSMEILGINEYNIITFNYKVREFNLVRQEILEDLIKLRNDIKPDLIFIPSIKDIHQDHRVVAEESLRAFKNNTTILGYELPWNLFSFSYQVVSKLEEKHVNKKIQALSMYKSQNFRNYFKKEFIKAWAKSRGILANSKFAEIFEVYRIFF